MPSGRVGDLGAIVRPPAGSPPPSPGSGSAARLGSGECPRVIPEGQDRHKRRIARSHAETVIKTIQ